MTTALTLNSERMAAAGSWELPEELRLIQDTARRFMLQEVKPIEDALELAVEYEQEFPLVRFRLSATVQE